jgi:hypothetical protein
VATIDALTLPFSTWQEGLLALADALDDPNREKIIVARLEATAAQIGIGPKEVCALALLVPSRARFEPAIKHEPHPEAARLGAMMGESLGKTLSDIADTMERHRQLRQERVFSAFPETDPRRLLIDTIVGFAAAELSDVSQRLGEADPFSRLAARMSLWFKQASDLSRYGIPYPHDGWPVIYLALRLAGKLDVKGCEKIQRLIQIWSGDVEVDRSDEGLEEIASLAPFLGGSNTDHLDALLALEIYGALAGDLDDLYSDALDALPNILEGLPRQLDDGRPRTADLQTWLNTPSHRKSRFRLIYDPSQAFWSAMHSDNADVLEPLLAHTLKQMSSGGHAIFVTGPLPIHGSLFNRDRKMMERLAEDAPEAADLFRLLGVDGDYNELDGPYSPQCYWVGDVNPDAITIPEAIENAAKRGDHALCDMLIGCWLLFCTLYQRAPLPDLVGLARCITALPADHRSSTYAVLGVLKREAVEDTRLRRDVDAVLSWLPLVDTAPPDDFEADMRDQFSPQLWNTIDDEEKQSLLKAEEFFVRVRRLGQLDREKEPLDTMIVGWSRVAEPVLRRVLFRVDGSGGQGKPLGQLIGMTKKAIERGNDSRSLEEKHRLRLLPAAMDVLDQLDLINKKGVKHLDGIHLTWEHVVNVHTGIHWALRTLLDAAAANAKLE